MTVIQTDSPRLVRKTHMHRHVAALQQATEALESIADAYGDRHLIDPADGAPLELRITQAVTLLDSAAGNLARALAALQPCLPSASTPACRACQQAARNVDNALAALHDIHHDH